MTFCDSLPFNAQCSHVKDGHSPRVQLVTHHLATDTYSVCFRKECILRVKAVLDSIVEGSNL
jgi:hypothetical protein